MTDMTVGLAARRAAKLLNSLLKSMVFTWGTVTPPAKFLMLSVRLVQLQEVLSRVESSSTWKGTLG